MLCPCCHPKGYVALFRKMGTPNLSILVWDFSVSRTVINLDIIFSVVILPTVALVDKTFMFKTAYLLEKNFSISLSQIFFVNLGPLFFNLHKAKLLT